MEILGKVLAGIFFVGVIGTVKVGEGICDLIDKIGHSTMNAVKKIVGKEE